MKRFLSSTSRWENTLRITLIFETFRCSALEIASVPFSGDLLETEAEFVGSFRVPDRSTWNVHRFPFFKLLMYVILFEAVVVFHNNVYVQRFHIFRRTGS